MKITYVLAIILIMVFSIGAQCSRSQADSTVEAPFNGGIEGLVAEFWQIGSVSDTGPDNQVWEDESFPVQARVMNKGEYTIPAHDVEFEIQGISQSDFTGIDFTADNDEEIDGVSEFLPDGGEITVDFGEAHYNNLVGTHYDANIKLNYIYPYETYINIPKVCYKEDIKDNTFCNVDETKQAFASGGPLAVGTVTESYIGKGKIMLEIPISNVQKGKAKAYKNDEFETMYDQVAFSIDDPDWECQARGNPSVARITRPQGEPGNEEAVIRCINEHLEAGALYQRAITLKLSYYYNDWITQTVRIRENPD